MTNAARARVVSERPADIQVERIPLAERLAAIMGDLGPIEKRGQIRAMGSGPSYNFARDVDILHAAVPKMAEAGIVMVPEHVELLSMTLTMSEKQFVANVKASWHVTDGIESLRFETFGQGADTGDKALPKAQSNARKYAFFMLYHIVTGDDPDQWASPNEQSQDGERATGAGRRTAHKPATTRPATDLRERLALVAAEHAVGLDTISALADEVGVPKGQRATDEQMLAIIARIEQPVELAPHDALPADGDGDRSGSPSPTDTSGSQEPVPAPTTAAGVDSPPAPAAGTPTDGEILAAAGEGAELIPPKPGTDEYRALPNGTERAKAKAWWDAHKEEQPTLAEALGGPSSD